MKESDAINLTNDAGEASAGQVYQWFQRQWGHLGGLACWQIQAVWHHEVHPVTLEENFFISLSDKWFLFLYPEK